MQKLTIWRAGAASLREGRHDPFGRVRSWPLAPQEKRFMIIHSHSAGAGVSWSCSAQEYQALRPQCLLPHQEQRVEHDRLGEGNR